MPPEKKKKKPSKSDSDSSGSEEIEDVKPSKESKPTKKRPKNDDDDEDEPSWHLGNKRFAKVRSFRGKLMIDIREFYEDNGELKPGKKGICLQVSQWKKLCEVIPEIEDAVKERA